MAHPPLLLLLPLLPLILIGQLECIQLENDSRRIGRDESRSISVILMEDGGLKVVTGQTPRAVVWASLVNGQASNGWLQLEIESRNTFPDELQARAAGVAEGYLTQNTISQYWSEFFNKDLCKDNKEARDKLSFCDYMRQQIDDNEAWLEGRIREEGDSDPVWHMMRLFYSQVDGITEGWKMKNEELGGLDGSNFDLKYGMRFINYLADAWDYVEKFNAENSESKKGSSKPTCSVLLKYIPDQDELYIGHNAWHEYRAMSYRFLKRYSLPYRRLPDSTVAVAATTVSMSSYPGSVFSLDDFVILSSGLVTTETSLANYNTSLYSLVHPEGQVFEGARVMAANRLATDGREWTDIAARYNSGTYNNQWMVIDYSKVEEGGTLGDGALWVMEQLPGGIWSEDQTAVLLSQGYWGSYNRAFYPEVFALSGAAEMVEKHGSWFSYSETPRARILARDQGGVTDLESMTALMRYNNFQLDPLSVVPGCPKPIPAASISNRCDLTLPASECSWESLDYMVGLQPYGAIDMKLTSRLLAAQGQFLAVLGPTHGPGMKPFSWRDTNITDRPDWTPIEVFNFEPSLTKWTLATSTATATSTTINIISWSKMLILISFGLL